MSEAVAALDDTLAALADPLRRRAVELLADRPRRAGELATALGATPSAMSKHLRVLRSGGLVTQSHPEFDTRIRVYALRSAPRPNSANGLTSQNRRGPNSSRRSPPTSMVPDEPSRVLVAVRVAVPVDRAFSAFTEEIADWWQPNGLFQFTDGRIGVLAFELGPQGRLIETYPEGDAFVVGHVRVWEPPHRLVLSWRHANFVAGQETELHVRFEDVSDSGVGAALTRVVVEHCGWDAIPAEHSARHGFPLAPFQLRWAEWWQAMLRDLADRVD